MQGGGEKKPLRAHKAGTRGTGLATWPTLEQGPPKQPQSSPPHLCDEGVVVQHLARLHGAHDGRVDLRLAVLLHLGEGLSRWWLVGQGGDEGRQGRCRGGGVQAGVTPGKDRLNERMAGFERRLAAHVEGADGACTTGKGAKA